MSLTFEKKPLLFGLSGGTLQTGGIIAMNTLPTNSTQRTTGIPLFTAGWGLIIKGFLDNDTRDPNYKYLLADIYVAVYMTAIFSRMMMESGASDAGLTMAKMVFMVSWVAVGLLPV